MSSSMKQLLAAVIAVLAMVTTVVGVTALSASAFQGATDDASEVEAGMAVFASNCAGCHASDGTGVAGRGRPLTGIAEQGTRADHIATVQNGKGNMPAFGSLSDDEVGAVISYVRLTFLAEDAMMEETMEETEAMEDAMEETELAQTGSDTLQLAVVAIATLGAGVMLVSRSRRQLFTD